MNDPHFLALKRNRFQKWLLIASILFFITALISFGINYFYLSKKHEDYSKETLSELFQKANDKYSKGEFSNAIPYLKEAADRGSARAQYSLGYMYQNGEGVGVDLNLAKEYFKLAAEQGHIKAKLALKKMDN